MKTYPSLWATMVPRNLPEGNNLGSHWLYWHTIGPSQAEVRCSRGREARVSLNEDRQVAIWKQNWAKMARARKTDKPSPVFRATLHPHLERLKETHLHTCQVSTQHPPVFTQPLSVMSKLDTFRSLGKRKHWFSEKGQRGCHRSLTHVPDI